MINPETDFVKCSERLPPYGKWTLVVTMHCVQPLSKGVVVPAMRSRTDADGEHWESVFRISDRSVKLSKVIAWLDYAEIQEPIVSQVDP